jgi:hypothetical protein
MIDYSLTHVHSNFFSKSYKPKRDDSCTLKVVCVVVIGININMIGNQMKHFLNLKHVSSAGVGTPNSKYFNVFLDWMVNDLNSF